MSNDCKHVDDFYEALKASGKYEPTISLRTAGELGTRSKYLVPTSGGFVSVDCYHSLWTSLDIEVLGPNSGTNGGICRVTTHEPYSKASPLSANSIKPLDPNGLLQLTTSTLIATVQLPCPKLK